MSPSGSSQGTVSGGNVIGDVEWVRPPDRQPTGVGKQTIHQRPAARIGMFPQVEEDFDDHGLGQGAVSGPCATPSPLPRPHNDHIKHPAPNLIEPQSAKEGIVARQFRSNQASSEFDCAMRHGEGIIPRGNMTGTANPDG